MVSKKEAFQFFQKHGYNHPEVCKLEEIKVNKMFEDMKKAGTYIEEENDPVQPEPEPEPEPESTK
jgi:hypothetical protein